MLPSKAELFNHPVGLTYLFGSEMWERFSYYGMRVLLPIYCLQYLLLPAHAKSVIGFESMKHAMEFVYGALLTPQQLQSAIYGTYTSLVYFTPLVGGFLADRYFGRRYTVVAGGILMAIGHFLMAMESYFYIALLFLIVGNGGFKPNISVQVGGLYEPGDHRIDRAYSIFYLGINVGAFLGQNVCGAFGARQMWSYGFGAAGIGMLIGSLIYLRALRVLPDARPKRAKSAGSLRHLTGRQWGAALILALLFLPGCLFWAAYEQSGNTVEVWTADRLNRTVDLGFSHFELSVGAIQSVNSIFIMVFTPLIVWIWKWQQARGSEPSPIAKMTLGSIFLSVSYLVLAAAQHAAGDGQVHWIWAIIYFAVYTVGELYFSPVGLSLYSKVAPPQIAALMMAIFLSEEFPGNFLAGWLGGYYSEMSNVQFFLLIAGISAATAPFIWIFRRPFQAIMSDRQMK